MKKITTLLLILLFFSNCGYTPIYSNKNLNFKLIQINKSNSNQLNSKVEKKLKSFSNKDSKNLIALKIDSQKKINILSKDSKGTASRYEMVIKINIDINYNKDQNIKKELKESFNYITNSNKFELTQYEKEIEELLINKIVENLIRFLSKT